MTDDCDFVVTALPQPTDSFGSSDRAHVVRIPFGVAVGENEGSRKLVRGRLQATNPAPGIYILVRR